MALIEKGKDAPDAFKEVKFPWLKLGIVIISVSIGVLAGLFAVLLFPENSIIRDAIILMMIILGLLFGGIGMLIAHFTEKREKE